METARRTTDAIERVEHDDGIERGWIAEQSDLLTFEEGLTGHPLSGAYICVKG